MTKKKAPKAAAPKKKVKGEALSKEEQRQRQFIEAYIGNGGNKTAAAIQAGANPKTAHVIGSRLYSHVKENGLLEQRQQQVLERLAVNSERILRRLVAIAEADITMFLDAKGGILPPRDWPAEARGAVQSLKKGKFGPEIKLHDVKGAVETAMKHLGLFKEDNKQKVDPLVSLMERIAERNKAEGFKPGAYGSRPRTTG